MKNTSLKIIPSILLILLSGLNTFSQGMPVDSVTKKVSYTGEVVFEGATKIQIANACQKYLSTITNFRGIVGSTYYEANTSTLYAVVFLNPTSSMKSKQYWLNGGLEIYFSEGKCSYKLSNFWVSSTTLSNMYGTPGKDSEIEKSENFYYDSFVRNKNVKVADEEISRFLKGMENYMQENL